MTNYIKRTEDEAQKWKLSFIRVIEHVIAFVVYNLPLKIVHPILIRLCLLSFSIEYYAALEAWIFTNNQITCI